MHRTLSGSPAALAAFAALGRITYTTAPDATATVTLEVAATDGRGAVRREVPIVVTPQPDRPQLSASGTLAGPASVAREISYNELLRATGAQNVDGDGVRFLVKSVQGGGLETWNGSRWVPMLAVRFLSAPANRQGLIGPETRLRWQPHAGSSVLPELLLVAWDGRLTSGSSCRLGFGNA